MSFVTSAQAMAAKAEQLEQGSEAFRQSASAVRRRPPPTRFAGRQRRCPAADPARAPHPGRPSRRTYAPRRRLRHREHSLLGPLPRRRAACHRRDHRSRRDTHGVGRGVQEHPRRARPGRARRWGRAVVARGGGWRDRAHRRRRWLAAANGHGMATATTATAANGNGGGNGTGGGNGGGGDGNGTGNGGGRRTALTSRFRRSPETPSPATPAARPGPQVPSRPRPRAPGTGPVPGQCPAVPVAPAERPPVAASRPGSAPVRPAGSPVASRAGWPSPDRWRAPVEPGPAAGAGSVRAARAVPVRRSSAAATASPGSATAPGRAPAAADARGAPAAPRPAERVPPGVAPARALVGVGRRAREARSPAPARRAGRGSGRGKDKRRQTADHDLFDDGQDWLDDDGAFEGLID